MPPHQRILAIKLSDKIAKNSTYAKNIGIEIKNQIKNKQSEEKK